MIAVVAALLMLTATGVVISRAIDPLADRLTLLADGFFVGCGTVALTLLFASLLAVRWNPAVAIVPLIAIASTAFLFSWRRRDADRAPSALAMRYGWLAFVLDLVTLVSVVSYLRFATAASPWEWDYWADWGLKAKVFFVQGGFDWSFLQSRWNSFAHAAYPPLLPLTYDWLALFAGSWNDRYYGLVHAAFAIAVTLAVRAEVRKESASSVVVSAATIVAAGAAMTPWIGIADGPLIALASAAILRVRRGLLDENIAALRSGAILLGLAALTKNEGFALLISVTVVAFVLTRFKWRMVLALWPAWAIAGVWQATKYTRDFHTYLFEGSIASRLASNIRQIPTLGRTMLDTTPDQPLLVVAAILGILIAWRSVLRRERFLALTISLQLLFYVSSYLLTPFDITWHVSTSWTRLVAQLTLPLALLAIFALNDLLENNSSVARETSEASA